MSIFGFGKKDESEPLPAPPPITADDLKAAAESTTTLKEWRKERRERQK